MFLENMVPLCHCQRGLVSSPPNPRFCSLILPWQQDYSTAHGCPGALYFLKSLQVGIDIWFNSLQWMWVDVSHIWFWPMNPHMIASRVSWLPWVGDGGLSCQYRGGSSALGYFMSKIYLLFCLGHCSLLYTVLTHLNLYFYSSCSPSLTCKQSPCLVISVALWHRVGFQ